MSHMPSPITAGPQKDRHNEQQRVGKAARPGVVKKTRGKKKGYYSAIINLTSLLLVP